MLTITHHQEMQIKTTRYFLTPVRMDITKKTTRVGKDVEKGNPAALLLGM